jgi:hypothetical protein
MIRNHLNRVLLIAAGVLFTSVGAAETPQGASPGKADKAAEHAARKSAQHDAQRSELRLALHGPMDAAMKQELRRHAQRVARIERIKALALELKDKEVIERANKLLEKETARHQKWMATATTPSQANAKAEAKGGAR